MPKSDTIRPDRASDAPSSLALRAMMGNMDPCPTPNKSEGPNAATAMLRRLKGERSEVTMDSIEMTVF